MTFRSRHLARGVLALALLGACSDREKGSPSDAERDAASDPSLNGGDGGAGHDPSAPAAPGVLPTFAPKFPGAGQSGDDAPLTNGSLCDYVPANGAPSPNDITTCFFGNGNPVPAATLEQVLECVEGQDVVHVRLTFNPAFVDNTYGSGSIGWPARRGHTFRDLYKSDHAELLMTDAAGALVLRFKIDYLSEDPSAVAGYGTLGVAGGDGQVLAGDGNFIVATSTSLHKNLNERGYASYTTDSPATDANYSVNPAAPNWDYRVVYEAWVDVQAFGSAGFGGASIESVHASPAKGDKDTIEVTPGPCPPENCTNPDGCDSGAGKPDGGIPSEACVPAPDQDCSGQPLPKPDAGCSDQPDQPCEPGPLQPNPPAPPPKTCKDDPTLPGCEPIY